MRFCGYFEPFASTYYNQYNEPRPVLRNCPIAGTVRLSTPQELTPATLTGSNGCDSVATLMRVTSPSSKLNRQPKHLPCSVTIFLEQPDLPSAGTYSVTLTGSTGCDSAVTLNLSVLPTTTSTTNLGLCPSQLPYSWNSQTINAAGAYTATLTGSNGCDSVATLILSINPASSSTVNQSICPSQLPYTWNSQTYNSAGTLLRHASRGSTGCDSVVTPQPLCVANNHQHNQPWPLSFPSRPMAGTVRPSTLQVRIPPR